MITTRIAEKKEFPKIKYLLEEYLHKNDSYQDIQIVGRRLVHEFNEGIEMTIFLAEKDSSILAVSNGVVGNEYGLSYHTLSFVQEQGIGSSLFRKKIDFLLSKKDIVVAKPESKAGLKMTLHLGFVREPCLDHLLYWQGESYVIYRK